MPFENPRNKREVITPEFPLAPLKRQDALTEAILPAVLPSSFDNSLTEFARVIDIFVPVSPSGTGKTFSSSTLFRLLERLLEADIIASRKMFPLNKIKTLLNS